MKLVTLPLLAMLAGCASLMPAPPLDAPRVDYHQHLVSATFEPLAKLPQRDARALLAEMDRAGVRQAVVHSVGYTYADERKKLADPDGLTRAENDWTSAQVASSGGRLIGFCGVNPLRDAALAEIERCLALPGMRGIKQHLGNGGITLRNAAHLARMRQVMALAEKHGAPILLHMRARGGTDYGAPDAHIFIESLLPLARSVPVIVAHLGASSPGYPAQNDEVMAAFADAARAGDPRLARLYFDVAANVTEELTPAEGALIARRIREIGVRHFLYGSDLSAPGGSIAAGWTIFRAKVPLTDREFARIAGQRLAFLR